MMNAVLADIKERLPNFMIIWSHIFKHAYWSNVVANLKGKKCRHRFEETEWKSNRLSGYMYIFK